MGKLKNIYRIRQTNSPNTGSRSDLFAIHRKTSSLKSVGYVQVYNSVGAILVNFMPIAGGANLANCFRARTQTVNDISFLVNGISIPEKYKKNIYKTSNIGVPDVLHMLVKV